MNSDDSAPNYPPRSITLTWSEGDPLGIHLEGDFDEWEVRAALREALAFYETSDEDADREP